MVTTPLYRGMLQPEHGHHISICFVMQGKRMALIKETLGEGVEPHVQEAILKVGGRIHKCTTVPSGNCRARFYVHCTLPDHVAPTTEEGLPDHMAPTIEEGLPDHMAPTTEEGLPDHMAPSTEEGLPDHMAPTTEEGLPDHMAPTTEEGLPDHMAPTTEEGLDSGMLHYVAGFDRIGS